MDRSAIESLGKLLQGRCAPLRSARSDHSFIDGRKWKEGNASLRAIRGLITDPKTWKEHKAEFQKGASDAGKDPARMPVFIEQYVVVGGKSELNEAPELWRFGPKAWKPYFNIRDPKTIQERAAADVPLEKVTEGWPVGTDPELHVKVHAELFKSGATGVHIHSGQRDQKRVIDFYGKEVFSRLQSISRKAA